MGLTFVVPVAYLLPLTAGTLLLAVGALGFRAERRRGRRPLAVGLVGALLLVVGKFTLDWAPMTYGGIALLIGASIWNAWPVKRCEGRLIQVGTQQHSGS